MVSDYDKESKDLLIGGRAFLATAGARIDMKRDISLKICDLVMEFGMDGSEFTKPISSMASSTDTTPENVQNPQTEPTTTLHSVQLANESFKASVLIDTHPLVDQHPRVSQTEDSANPLHPTPISDLCEKFSSISSPVIPLITSFESSKCASPLNEPRVPQKLVSSVDLAGNKESVDRHNQQCRSTPAATQPGTVYTPPWKARLQQKSSTTLFTS